MKCKTIADTRQELGLTQQEVADLLGVVRQTYAKMEQHPEDMTIKDARRLSKILGGRFEEIFFGSMVR